MIDTSFLSKKTLKELEPVVQSINNLNTIDPTEEEIMQIIELFKLGTSHKNIKTSIRRKVGNGVLGFSYEQIKEIEKAWRERLNELAE